MSLTERLEFIRVELNRLRELDPECNATTSAFHHRYKLNPIASVELVEAFEQQHQITLPEEYRAFLLQLGNGGAGPDYGLDSLREWAPWGTLNQTFPHTQCWSPYEQDPCPPVDLPQGRSFEGESWKRLWDGCLEIGGAGCDFKNLLVITGSERGNMWLSEMDNEIGFMPYCDLVSSPGSCS